MYVAHITLYTYLHHPVEQLLCHPRPFLHPRLLLSVPKELRRLQDGHIPVCEVRCSLPQELGPGFGFGFVVPHASVFAGSIRFQSEVVYFWKVMRFPTVHLGACEAAIKEHGGACRPGALQFSLWKDKDPLPTFENNAPGRSFLPKMLERPPGGAFSRYFYCGARMSPSNAM